MTLPMLVHCKSSVTSLVGLHRSQISAEIYPFQDLRAGEEHVEAPIPVLAQGTERVSLGLGQGCK